MARLDLLQLRELMETYIATQDRRGEWHSIFVGTLANWLVSNGGARFVPMLYWNPEQPG